MRLCDVVPADAVFDPRHAGLEVVGIASDSRVLKAGEIFAAIAGTRTDGARFVADALARGAAAILAESPPDVPLPATVPFVRVPNVRRALALTAARFFPRQPAIIAAVTGTSGKTSVAAFLRQIWQHCGHASASVGTVGVVTAKRETYGSLTTPDPVALHRLLQEFADEGVTHLAMEASSHGLDQHRLDGVRISIAAFTNLSRDHLDYHSTLDEYLAAKLRLFSEVLPADGVAVVNADDPHAAPVIAAAKQRGVRVLTVGRVGEAVRLIASERRGFGQRLTLRPSAGYDVDFRVKELDQFSVTSTTIRMSWWRLSVVRIRNSPLDCPELESCSMIGVTELAALTSRKRSPVRNSSSLNPSGSFTSHIAIDCPPVVGEMLRNEMRCRPPDGTMIVYSWPSTVWPVP